MENRTYRYSTGKPLYPFGYGLSDVGNVASGLRAAMYIEVFRRGDYAIVVGIIALHARDQRDGHATDKERIFAVSLLSTSPTRIAKDINVGCPEIEAMKN